MSFLVDLRTMSTAISNANNSGFFGLEIHGLENIINPTRGHRVQSGKMFTNFKVIFRNIKISFMSLSRISAETLIVDLTLFSDVFITYFTTYCLS